MFERIFNGLPVRSLKAIEGDADDRNGGSTCECYHNNISEPSKRWQEFSENRSSLGSRSGTHILIVK